jgi:hypothetical protein
VTHLAGAYCSQADPGPELFVWFASPRSDGRYDVEGVFFLVRGSRLVDPQRWRLDPVPADQLDARTAGDQAGTLCGASVS